METRKVLLASFALAAAAEFVGSATAQTYPSRPIMMVVEF